jgi:hypothetical protein
MEVRMILLGKVTPRSVMGENRFGYAIVISSFYKTSLPQGKINVYPCFFNS